MASNTKSYKSTQDECPRSSTSLMGMKMKVNLAHKQHHRWTNQQGAVSIRKTVLPGMAIPMLKIRRPNGRLIFNMEIAIRR